MDIYEYKKEFTRLRYSVCEKPKSTAIIYCDDVTLTKALTIAGGKRTKIKLDFLVGYMPGTETESHPFGEAIFHTRKESSPAMQMFREPQPLDVIRSFITDNKLQDCITDYTITRLSDGVAFDSVGPHEIIVTIPKGLDSEYILSGFVQKLGLPPKTTKMLLHYRNSTVILDQDFNLRSLDTMPLEQLINLPFDDKFPEVKTAKKISG
jgi:hypothetical protein